MDAHDFRRVGATKIVDNALKSKEKQIREHSQSGNETEYNKILVDAVNQAAEYLNDKAVTALKAYIAPQVLDQFTPERIEKHLRWVSGIADDEDAKHDI